MLNSLKFDNDVSKSQNYNPFRQMENEPQRGRNLVNRSLCYDSHNSSIANNPQNNVLN